MGVVKPESIIGLSESGVTSPDARGSVKGVELKSIRTWKGASERQVVVGGQMVAPGNIQGGSPAPPVALASCGRTSQASRKATSLSHGRKASARAGGQVSLSRDD